MQNSEVYFDQIKLIVLFGLLAFFTNWVAKAQGFYTFPQHRAGPKAPLPFKSLAIVFGIYLLMTMGVSSVFSSLIHTIYAFSKTPPPFVVVSYVQLMIILMTLVCFYLYTHYLDPALAQRIFKDRTVAHSKPIYVDFGMGAITWVIGFPLVIAIGQLTDLLLLLLTGFQNYEQVAVHYLKMTLPSPPMLTIALFTILLAAPAIEEFLFRGFLQTYLKQFMNVKLAIVISSLCFALFHLAPSQGMGNISLVISLFTFALFLGFIYEKQGSLFASFSLHMTFNAVSTFRILFFS